MAEIHVKPIEDNTKRLSNRELYAMVCFYYPRYSLKQVQAMPARDVNLLLRTARRLEAAKKYDLVLIVSAPHAKDTNTVKNLADFFLSASKD